MTRVRPISIQEHLYEAVLRSSVQMYGRNASQTFENINLAMTFATASALQKAYTKRLNDKTRHFKAFFNIYTKRKANQIGERAHELLIYSHENLTGFS